MSSSSSDTCYGTRNSCPSTSVTSCTHSEDVTVECSKYNRINIFTDWQPSGHAVYIYLSMC